MAPGENAGDPGPVTSPELFDDPRARAAIAAVRAAADVTRAVQQDLADAGTLEKADRSPVTVADYAAQAVVAHVLEGELGPVRLVAEEHTEALREPEQAELLAETVERARRAWPDVTPEALLEAIDRGTQDPDPAGFWTLDPVDGTKGFLRDAHYAVCLARIDHGEVTLGVLGCPNLAARAGGDLSAPGAGALAVAAKGQGAWAGALTEGGPLERFSYPGRGTDTVRVCESVEKKHSNFDANAEILESAGLVGSSVRLDSQAKYLVVARGDADLYLRLPSKKGYVEKIWDHAAGSLVAQEAGLVVSDFAGRDLDFTRGRRLEDNRGVLVASPEHHPRLVAAIRKLGFADEPE